MYLALGALYWGMFSLWAGVIATFAMIAITNGLMLWAQMVRRRRGLAPLPPIWRNWPSDRS